MAQLYEDVLHALVEAQQGYELSIIKISKPILTAINQSSTTRISDVSADGFESLSPASLGADLSHYKELFSKLRFSYVEQVTKEKFIRAIVGDPPVIVDHQENIKLEQQLDVVKASLKAQKNEVAEIVTDLERRGRELARKYEAIELQTTKLRELPDKIEGLQASIEVLKAAQAPGPNPDLHLPLEKTLALLAKKEEEQRELDRELEQLSAELPRKTKELERLEAEMQPLEIRRLGSTASAREAKRRKEEALGGVGDDLEARGRWWRGVESGLKIMLGVEN